MASGKLNLYSNSGKILTISTPDDLVNDKTIVPLGKSDFIANKSTNGYQKLPSGLIIQWGKVQIKNSSSDADSTVSANVTFPISFPNTLLNVFVSSQENGHMEASEHVLTVVSASSSAAKLLAERLTGTNDDNENFYLNWLAIGY